MEVKTIAGRKGTYGSKDGNLSDALFYYPSKTLCDKERFIWVCDQEDFCLRRILPDGEVQTINECFGSGKGRVAKTLLIACIDDDGNVYIVDRIWKKIQKIGPDGNRCE